MFHKLRARKIRVKRNLFLLRLEQVVLRPFARIQCTLGRLLQRLDYAGIVDSFVEILELVFRTFAVFVPGTGALVAEQVEVPFLDDAFNQHLFEFFVAFAAGRVAGTA